MTGFEAFLYAVGLGFVAVLAFIAGGLVIPPAEATGRRSLGKEVVVLWVIAAITAAACVVFLYIALTHLVGGGGED